MALANATLQVEKAMTAASWLCAALASETPERVWKLLPASREAAAKEPAAPYVADTSERISKAATSTLHSQVPEIASLPTFRTANNKSSDEGDENGKGPVSHGDAYGSTRPVPGRREPLLPWPSIQTPATAQAMPPTGRGSRRRGPPCGPSRHAGCGGLPLGDALAGDAHQRGELFLGRVAGGTEVLKAVAEAHGGSFELAAEGASRRPGRRLCRPPAPFKLR